MASETLNLNDTISHEEENPSEALDPTDTSITEPDCPENTLNSLIQSPLPPSIVNLGTGKDVDALDNKNGGRSVGLAKTSGIDEHVSDILKKICRAERFGMPVQLSEEEKRNTRAERFGTGPAFNGSDGSKKAEEGKRKARAERFGLTVPSDASNEDAKKKARLARFASVSKMDAPNAVEEDKRKARAIRFSNSSLGSLSQVNGKGNIEPEAAIAGKASGGV